MRHTPSGIHVVVGGTCSFHMVGMRNYEDVVYAADGEDLSTVAVLLGVDH